MSSQQLLPVKDLKLDLENPRIGIQATEKDVVNALIEAHPQEFWYLMGSLLEEDGYEPTENILVLRTDSSDIVKEGNRRIAALKVINGYVNPDVDIPQHVKDEIGAVTTQWKKANKNVPCLVYEVSEKAKLDKIVARIHGKKARAGRLMWESLAKARDHRKHGGSEPALDILESYLERGAHLKKYIPKDRWEGDFPYSVLDEAVKKLAPLLGKKNSKELATAYPDGLTKKYAEIVDRVTYDIGMEQVQTRDFRDEDWWLSRYGIGTGKAKSGAKKKAAKAKSKGKAGSKAGGSTKDKASASNDPKSVTKRIQSLAIHGSGREKLETLRVEATKINVKNAGHAFCFLLRSMFEISARAYCVDNKAGGLSFKYQADVVKKGKVRHRKGEAKALRVVMNEIVAHIGTIDPEKKGVLKKALSVMQKADSPLSIDSLNHLIHSNDYSVSATDISIHFNNVFPLLEAMNS